MTNNHKKKTEFSIRLALCLVIIALIVAGSTGTRMVFASTGVSPVQFFCTPANANDPACQTNNAPSSPAVDCTNAANANDPACQNSPPGTTGYNQSSGTPSDNTPPSGTVDNPGLQCPGISHPEGIYHNTCWCPDESPADINGACTNHGGAGTTGNNPSSQPPVTALAPGNNPLTGTTDNNPPLVDCTKFPAICLGGETGIPSSGTTGNNPQSTSSSNSGTSGGPQTGTDNQNQQGLTNLAPPGSNQASGGPNAGSDAVSALTPHPQGQQQQEQPPSGTNPFDCILDPSACKNNPTTETNPDGSTTIWYGQWDRSIKQPDGTIITAVGPGGNIFIRPPAGSDFSAPVGSTYDWSYDHTFTVKAPDGKSIYTRTPDGSSITDKPDGTVITFYPSDGTKIITKPDGTKTILRH